MRIICLNVGLFEINNTKLEDFLKSQQADILCLQEVTRRLNEKALEKFISIDSIDTSSPQLTSSFFGPNWVMKDFIIPNFHGKDLFEFDLNGYVEFGNYVKSRFKIIKGQTIFVQNHFSLVTDWSKWPTEDYKSFQVVDMYLKNGKKLRVINYHGIWSKNKKDSPLTIAASRKINQSATEVSYPVIICGDFNLFPDTESIKILSKNFTSLVDKFPISTTRPKSNELSNLDRNIVDYIFVSPNVKVKKFEVLNSNVSDHLPLILDFNV